MTMGDKIATNGIDVCNLFADNFSSVYSGILPSGVNTCAKAMSNNYLTIIQFDDDQVLKVLKNLDSSKGAGSDGIPAVFVSKTASALAHPLRLIYNRSLKSGVFPLDWKLALVVPLHKDGSKDMIKNYRPISILPVFAKILEQLLHPILTWHFKNLISPHQHGFMKSRSTTTNLLSFINAISVEVDKRLAIDAIYTDFSKAFDRVNHQRLLQKLSAYGIAEPLLSWCTSYLSDRQSTVVASGFYSDRFPALSGVPQGSHLGPLFFNIFINDISDCFLRCNHYLFADDLKLFKVINSSSDTLLLQEDIDRLATWCCCNGMNLNTSKCYSVHFSRKKTRIPFKYKINGSHLKELDSVRDLGVEIDKELRFRIHIDNICSKAFKSLGFVLRNCRDFKDPKTKILLYNSYVRSTLEYCSVTWNPFYEVYNKKLESVQKRFMWHLAFSCNVAKTIRDYPARLKYFHMSSLSDRRRTFDLLFLYKLVNGAHDVPELLSSLNFPVPTTLTRASRLKVLTNPKYYTNLGKNAPLNRIITLLNSLHSRHSLDLFTSTVSSFKRAIRNIDLVDI